MWSTSFYWINLTSLTVMCIMPRARRLARPENAPQLELRHALVRTALRQPITTSAFHAHTLCRKPRPAARCARRRTTRAAVRTLALSRCPVTAFSHAHVAQSVRT